MERVQESNRISGFEKEMVMSHVNCPICESENTLKFWKNVWGSPQQTVWHCRDCELFFLNPLRLLEEQKEFDRKYNSYIADRETFVGGDLAGTFAESVDESLVVRFRDLKSYFPKGTSVLEIGAEKAGFLSLLKEIPCHPTGVDSCPEYYDEIQRKGFRAYSYIDEVPENEKFDIICFFSLLEHILEPETFLKSVLKRLTKSGKIILEVPSAMEPLVRLYDLPAFKDFYFQGMHPFVYSKKSLEIIFKRCGIEIEKWIPKQRYGLSNHLKWIREGKPGGSRQFDVVFAGSAEAEYVKALEAANQTDTAYIIAKIGPS